MKRILLSMVAFATLTLPAQTNNDNVPPAPIVPSKFSVGLKGGFGPSFIMPYHSDFFPSWNAGFSLTYAPWAHWGITLDPIYSAEGAKFKNTINKTDGTTTTYTSDTKLDYIRIPLKAVYFFRTYEKDFRPKITLGPSLGILVNDHQYKQATAIDLGAQASIGFNYRLARAIWFTADAAYYHGFIDVDSNSDGNEFNENARLDLGISFGF